MAKYKSVHRIEYVRVRKNMRQKWMYKYKFVSSI